MCFFGWIYEWMGVNLHIFIWKTCMVSISGKYQSCLFHLFFHKKRRNVLFIWYWYFLFHCFLNQPTIFYAHLWYYGINNKLWLIWVGFPGSSVGKESACNVGDPGSIPGSGRSTGERIGYPLQYSWASLVAQLVKNPPAMWETWVGSLGWEDPLEKGKATHPSILAWRIPWTI